MKQPLDTEYARELRAFMGEETRKGRVIAYDPLYADMAGDVLSGLVLSQICYWHSADKQGKTRLRVAKDGRLWAAVSVKDMCDDTRLTPSQVSRAYGILVGKELVLKRVWRFAGTPTTHISLNWPEFCKIRKQCEAALLATLAFAETDTEAGDADLPAVDVSISDVGEIDLGTNAQTQSGFQPRRKSKRDQSEIITDTSTHISSEGNPDSLVSTQENRRPPVQSKTTTQNAARSEVESHFKARTNLRYPPGMNAQAKGRMWWNPIREICELANWDVTLAKQIVDDALKELTGLTVSDPNSIIKTARSVAAKVPKKPTRQKVKVRDPETGQIIEREAVI